MNDPYSKPAIVQLLMTRDHMTEEEAIELVQEVQEEFDKALAEDGNGPDYFDDILRGSLGLEPDYIPAFIRF